MDLLAQAKAAADKLADQTEDKGGSYEYTPPVAGPCIARFVSYIEIGKHPQRAYQGKEKPPAHEAILEFELLGKKHAREIEFEDENGETVKKTVYPIHREVLAIKSGPKAGFFKLLSCMDYGRGNTHMAFMLGEAFLLNIVHNEVEKDGNKRTYANIKDDSGWKVGAPVRVDEEGETQVIKAPPANVEPRLLLWDAPTIEQWNSIHIPGTYTKKDGDKEVEVSKNWIQLKVQEALDWEGSGIQQIVAGIAGDLPDAKAETLPDAGEEPLIEEPGTEDAPEVEKATSEAPAASSDDPLADLGL